MNKVKRSKGRLTGSANPSAAEQRVSGAQTASGDRLEIYAFETILVVKGLPGIGCDTQVASFAAEMEEPHYCIMLEGGTGTTPHDVVLTDIASFKQCSPGRYVSMSLLIPKCALAQPDRITPDLPVRLSVQAGFGHLLSNIMLSLPDVVVRLDTPDHSALAASISSVIKAAFFDAMPALKAKCRVSTLDRIKAHIDYKLDNPDLNPGDVAHHMGISRRYLHQLFAETSETFVTYLQRQRVDRIAQDLCDPSNSETITECAFRWGFNDPSHFSRVFRRLKGRTATAFINAHQGKCIDS